MKIGRRSEPVVGEMTWEDLWLGVICLSNPEIAGSPRDIFRYSLVLNFSRGRATRWSSKRKRAGSTKLRIREKSKRESVEPG